MNNKINLARGRTLDFAEPVIMGIVNVTPDSFSDGGQFLNTTAALSHAMQLLDDGATILDIGGESTRPGAPDVSLEDELKRVIPIIKAIREQSDCVISIDTSKAEVMRQAIEAGADIVMLDNFSPDEIKRDSKIFKERFPHVVVEASGGIREDTIGNFLCPTVDVISQGSLTQGYATVDFSMKLPRPADMASHRNTGGGGEVK